MSGGLLILVRTLFVAALGLTSLSACVSNDLRAGPSASLAPTAPLIAEPVAPAQRLTAVMPGELLLEPGREAVGIDPQTILTRSSSRVAHAYAAPPRRTVAHAARLAAVSSSAPVRAAEPSVDARSTVPLLAARLSRIDAPAGAPTGVHSSLTPLADVEARAEAEQRAQASRDRRFDAQVRRASSLVCSGCVSGTRRSPAQAEQDGDAVND